MLTHMHSDSSSKFAGRCLSSQSALALVVQGGGEGVLLLFELLLFLSLRRTLWLLLARHELGHLDLIDALQHLQPHGAF